MLKIGNPKLETILEGLNPKQIGTVKALNGPVLIVAGPGAGKTKCLTHRIGYMVYSGIKPENILAVTFTNKAAGEMKERVEKLLRVRESELNRLTIGTFHSTCARILRKEAKHLNYNRNFVIYDKDDQLNLIKQVLEKLQIDPKRFNIKAIHSRISRLKTELISPEKFQLQGNGYFEKIVAQVYAAYQEALLKAKAMDFDDLIMQTVKLFEKKPEILEKYQDKFKYILVDEYQDTDTSQYMFVKLLSKKYKNLFTIGDSDQTIFTFRNADFRNMLNFEKDFPEAKIIFLEQNYRSTKNIITAAQHLIKNNQYRHLKNLWTQNGEGEKPYVSCLSNELEEGLFITGKMKELLKIGYKLNDFVVLYRTHAQSRAIEEVLLQEGFPYKIVGGVKFYERREIKDILAYLKILANPDDTVSLRRVYNVPPRGIGKASYVKILNFAAKNRINLVAAFVKISKDSAIFRIKIFNLIKFGKQLKDFKEKLEELNLTQLTKYIIKKIDYENYINDGTKEGESRWENVKELLTVIKGYNHLSVKDALNKFLEEVALIQEADKVEEDKNLIHMMTLHSAKGLEFPVVFIAGLEDGLLPHSKSISNPAELEEERRLLYVGITRAEKKLYLTLTQERNIFGSTQYNLPSRFLEEIPEEAVNLESLII